MTAVAGELPADDDAWAYEIKWDGMRTLVALDGGRLTARSRRRRGIEAGIPELDHLPRALGGVDVLLDGELVAFDDRGHPSFARLADRMHISDRHAATARIEATPVAYVIFDLLHLGGHDTYPLPYLERRRLLADLIGTGEHWQVPAHHIGGGAELLDAVTAQGLEGVMAKRPDRPYEPGRRSASWRKVKIRAAQEFVVGGWTPGSGSREGLMGALVLGAHDEAASGTDTGADDRKLRWVGNVGTGFTDAMLRDWTTRLTALATSECPFDPPPVPGPTTRGARWVRPELVVQVAFTEWTPDGRLRHPAFLGERDDIDPADVTTRG